MKRKPKTNEQKLAERARNVARFQRALKLLEDENIKGYLSQFKHPMHRTYKWAAELDKRAYYLYVLNNSCYSAKQEVTREIESLARSMRKLDNYPLPE